MFGGVRPRGGHRAFWSYTTVDDRAEGGRISSLRDLVAKRVTFLTGEEFPIFLDRDAIEWGRRWAPAIEGALDRSTFLIPVLTPQYFQSQACRAELSTFLSLARDGRETAVLPIHYAEVEGIRPGTTSTDPLVRLVKELQNVEWEDIALEDEWSTTHRSAVHLLAKRLIAAAGADGPGPPAPPTRGATGTVDMTDLLAAVERARRDIEGHVRVAKDLTAELGRVARGRTAGTKFTHRVAEAGQFAFALDDPSARAEAVATDLLRAIAAVDPDVTRLGQTALGAQPSDATAELLAALRTTAVGAEESLAAFEDVSLTIADATAFSPEALRPNERLRVGSDRSSQARTILRSWVSLLTGPAERRPGDGRPEPG